MAPPTSRSGFQIAFVTAVPTEYDALYELFDEKYDRNGTIYGKGPGDVNIYTTGKMGKYNVVLLCLADIGKMHAAQAVSSLRMSYLGIKYIFVVGICGGAPFDGDHPIYLGDVIISTRLIEYDYGRQYPGMFKLKDTYLKTQNLEVRNLHRFLSTENSKLDFQARVSHHLAQLSPQRSKPPISAPDILYNSDYVHRHRASSLACDCSASDICEEATHQDCGKLGCEERQIRRRRIETHGPNIHFGAMASADRVLKSGVDREWLTKTHGVLGFEMEGAGLWDGIISCTIIKGICDYADSHKRKTWQDFAAGAGAAATKAILEQLTLSPDDQSIENRIMIPFARNTYFTGRQDELKELEEMISTPDGPRKLAVTGLGGIGKSQIALELAHRLSKTDAKRLVFWIPCTSFETIEQGFVDIVQTLDLRKADPAEAKETVQVHLSQHLTKWLLILDNVDDESVWVFLEKFLPQSDEGRTLVTTRTWQVAAKVAGTSGSGALKRIEQPSEETAIEMLKTRLLNKELVNETEAATALLRRLTYLPLAITQAAAYISQTGPDVTLSDYLRLLDNQEQEVVKLLSEKFRDETRYVDAPNPVASTWLVSFEQIRKSNSSAAQFLSLMACVDPCRIPRDFLPSLESDKEKLEALALLNGFSFITMEPREGPITLHRLVHLATRNWMRKNGTLTGYRQQAVDLIDKTMFDATDGNKPLVRKLLPHSFALLNDIQPDFDVRPRDLHQLTAVFLNYEGRHQEARTVLRQVLSFLEAVCEDGDSLVLTMKATVVNTYIDQAQFDKAEQLGLYVLEKRKEFLGTEHADTLDSMNQLAGLYKKQEKWDKAMPLYQQLLDMQKQGLSARDDTALSGMKHLAATFSALGDLKKAEEAQFQALRAAQHMLGPDHEDTLFIMNQLATTYLCQGRHVEARVLANKVLDETRKNSKLGHHLVTSSSVLAASYEIQRKWEQAEEFAVQAFAKAEEFLGPDHPHTLRTVDPLVRIYIRQKKWKAAQDAAAPAIDTAKTKHGPRHPLTLALMSSLALAYRLQERWPEAEKVELQVFQGQMDILGLRHSKTLASMDSLQEIQTAQGRGEETKRLKEQALKIEVKEQGRGLGNPEVLENMHRLALTWHGLGRLEDAQELMARTLQLRKEVCGLNHEATGASAKVLASWEEAIPPERPRLRERLHPRTWLGKIRSSSRTATPLRKPF
ncbi:hypothetical protein BJX68DRAFT_152922 [Aspergillus pseudodeflectus]|uniref:AAA+ ATPase domain-containing protein n=1 Tax=Aspergillus pseudodeflectus TaxID=176178 RepID=A0ABR4JW00_9EURO